ncbi:MAG: hypothetical protein K6F52_07705 [Clostridia bacterium]|nr:hypothetical protein [Clostridia bacterium]
MERIFLREEENKEKFNIREREKIAVIGSGTGAGASFTASALAKRLSMEKGKAVAYAEVFIGQGRKRKMYDALGMEKRFAGRDYLSMHELLKSGSIRGRANIDEGINWAVCSGNTGDFSPLDCVRLINNVLCDTLVYCMDSDSFKGELAHCEDILCEADKIVYVIDPLPSALLSSHELTGLIKRLEYRGHKVVWVINKSNSGINKRELLGYLKLKKYFEIPAVDPRYIYNCEYNCRIPYTHREVFRLIGEPVENIVLS